MVFSIQKLHCILISWRFVLIFSIFTGYEYSRSSRWSQGKRVWLRWVWKPQQPYQCPYDGWHSTFRHFELITAKQGCHAVLMLKGQEVVFSARCPHCLWSCSQLALWLLQFGLGFPHVRCPFCYVQSFCSPVFVPIFLRSDSASSNMIQLLFFSLLLACIQVNAFIIFVSSVLLSCLSHSKLCTLIRVTV